MYTIILNKTTFSEKKIRKLLQVSKKYLPLQPQSREMRLKRNSGALVQLVRIHACHAWGHGFESRTHRFLKEIKTRNRLTHSESGGFFYN